MNKIEHTVDKTKIGHWIHLQCRWTVDKLEWIVDNIGLMEENLDGLNSTTLDGQWKTKNIHFLTYQVNATRFNCRKKQYTVNYQSNCILSYIIVLFFLIIIIGLSC